MEEIKLEIRSASTTKVSLPWGKPCPVSIQRLYYIKGGIGYFVREDGQKERLQKGNIYIYPKNLKEQFSSDPEDPMDHAYFDFLSTPPIIAPQPLIYPVKPGSSVAEFITFLDRLLQEHNAENRVSRSCWQQRKRILCNVLEALLRMLSEEKAIPFSNDAAVSAALELIHTHYSQNLSVEVLAAKAGFAPNSFIRHFKRVMGQTPYAYLKDYRLLKACELLSEGMTIAQAAEQVGYENGSSLSRALAGQRK